MSILLELLLVPRKLLLLDRGIDLLDIEGRDDGEILFELPRGLCRLEELLDEDLGVDGLRPCLDASTGSVKITAPHIIKSIKFRLNLDFFIIKPRQALFY